MQTPMNYTYEFCTRSMNYRLYCASKYLFSEIGIKNRRLLFKTADQYIYDALKTSVDFVINIDEDAFLLNPQALQGLLNYMCHNEIACCGIPDGGVACRGHNPFVMNAFFNIFNVKLIRQHLKEHGYKDIEQAVSDFDYVLHKEQMWAKFPKQLITLSRAHIDETTFEPYYPFFLWLAGTYPVLYLRSDVWRDNLSTLLYDHMEQPLLIHTWYSREYNRNSYHTSRINAVIEYASEQQRLPLFEMSTIQQIQYKIESVIHPYIIRIVNFAGRLSRYINRLFRKAQ